MIKKFLFWIIKRYKINKIINEVDFEYKILQNSKYIIDKGTVLYREANIYNLQQDPTKIILGHNSHIRATLQVFKYGGKIEIGENTYIGDYSRIWSGDYIKIGDDVLISHNVNIIDTSAHEKEYKERSSRSIELLKNGPWTQKGNVITKPIIICNNVWISFNVTILRGVTIGEGAIIGANSVVTKDVPPFTFVHGNPSQIVSILNKNV
jgi:acetyltransferase-like isoleucine patch superfamily enzyme